MSYNNNKNSLLVSTVGEVSPELKKMNETTNNISMQSKSTSKSMLNILADNLTWNFALNDLTNLFKAHKTETNCIQCYTLNYYFKKVLFNNFVVKKMFISKYFEFIHFSFSNMIS